MQPILPRLLILPLLAVTAVLLASCSSTMKPPPPPTVSNLDLPRFMGDWHVIAHVPYYFEKGKVGTIDRYQLRPDGKIDNTFLFRRKTLDAPLEEWKAKAWVHNQQTNAEWRVQFIWPFAIPYLILDVDPDYQWAAVGIPSRKLAWILSKQTVMPESAYRDFVKKLTDKGYPTEKLVKVPQLPPR